MSNAEIKPLREDLVRMRPAWSGIRQPVAMVHDYLYPEEDHFILWERLDLFVPILLACVDWPAMH